jgi:Spy/CpxP family protein refolding chaperone
MKSLLKIALAGFVVLGLSATVASADVTKGQKLYSKKLKKSCKLSGAEMAKKHSQGEWEEIMENGKLNDEIKNICGKGTKDKYLEHLYDFFYEYASDSGNVPSC